MKRYILSLAVLICTLVFQSCSIETPAGNDSSCLYAGYFDIIRSESPDSSAAVVVISPYGKMRDTLIVEKPLDNIICMSSSQVAGLAEIGADDMISAVSGLRYITNQKLHERRVPDIGYEASLDYEKILSIKPDVVLAYTVSGSEPPYLSRLRDLGIRVLILHDHLEDHPLARAEYIRLYGVLTGRQELADSVFSAICSRYDSLAVKTSGRQERVKVLMNVPYGDAWYIPGGDSYMARLVNDAGGEILGSVPGASASSVISLEDAYGISRSADIWLNPGPCTKLAELLSFHHSFKMFGPVEKGLPIYNNTLRSTPEGGNDFWESGSVRPDLILKDLIAIFSKSEETGYLEYHFQVK